MMRQALPATGQPVPVAWREHHVFTYYPADGVSFLVDYRSNIAGHYTHFSFLSPVFYMKLTLLVLFVYLALFICGLSLAVYMHAQYK